jgi:uncharacterized protein YacL
VARTDTTQARAVAAPALAGSVKDAEGLPVVGAIVLLRNEATGVERVERTTGTGAFTFRAIGIGTYVVVASLSGFAPATLSILQVLVLVFVALLLSYGGIESGLRKRLDGLAYVMAPQALMPDERLVRWVLESIGIKSVPETQPVDGWR